MFRPLPEFRPALCARDGIWGRAAAAALPRGGEKSYALMNWSYIIPVIAELE
jgi:hypothetical protein